MKFFLHVGIASLTISVVLLNNVEQTTESKPERVELYEKGELRLVLSDTAPGSLNNTKGYNNRVYTGLGTSVKIYGRKGGTSYVL